MSNPSKPYLTAKTLGALVVGVTAMVAPAVAKAQCAMVDPVVVPQLLIDPLDASGPAELVQPLMLTFRRTGTDAAVGSLAIRYQIVDEDSNVQSRVGESRGPTVEWQAPGSSRDVGAFRSEAYSLLRSGLVTLGDNEHSAQSPVNLRVTNLRADLAAGVYREQFTVRYWCGDDPSVAPYDAQALVGVTVAVPNVLSANIAGVSQRGKIDFYDFAMLRRQLQVSVRSTGPFNVTARSLNGGELLRENGNLRDTADTITYEARFDGELMSLEGASQQRQSRAGLSGRQIPLEVEVGSIEAKRAGRYRDTLLLTLSPAN